MSVRRASRRPEADGVAAFLQRRPWVLRRGAPVASRAPGAFALFTAFFLETAVAAAPPAGAAPGVTAGSVAQVVVGLAAVLALFGAVAWLLKRYSGLRGTGAGLIRIIGGASVGQRERIVLVEIGSTWIVVGVAPGQVRALHTMPKGESAATPDAPAPMDQGFAGWLRRMSEKRNHA